MPRRLAVALGALLFLSLGTACGVPTDTAPRDVRDRDVPFGLLDRPAATTTTTVPPAPGR